MPETMFSSMVRVAFRSVPLLPLYASFDNVAIFSTCPTRLALSCWSYQRSVSCFTIGLPRLSALTEMPSGSTTCNCTAEISSALTIATGRVNVLPGLVVKSSTTR